VTGAVLRLATWAMGTRFELVMPGSSASLRAAGEAAIEEIENWHGRLNRFASDSLVAHINRTAARHPVRLDDQMFALFAEAERIRHASGGAFDVAGGAGDAVVLDHEAWTIRFLRPDVAVDLGGIAKGHALDRAAALLWQFGVTSALLHGGTSSVVAIGTPAEDSAGWRIAIGSAPEAAVLTLRDRALSVSDACGQRALGTASHIRDPRTGDAIVRGGQIAVVGPSARTADAWSTALVVRGDVPQSFDSDYQLSGIPIGPGASAAEAGTV
jgi:FAD:protein FMN transferase